MRKEDLKRFTYKEFCDFMKKYNHDCERKESKKHINKLAYKPVFKKHNESK